MLIKRLEVNNFRQFKGKQIIDFSTDEYRNITLILGDNTSGKTTLLQSVLWCLYGKANFKSKDILLNEMLVNEILNSSKEISKEISVTINLIHEDYEYTITRSQSYAGKNGTITPNKIYKVKVIYKDKNGQTIEMKPYHIISKINEILPEDLSTYFLYDTERFGNITTKSDVSEAVKGLLGLTVLENIKKHIGRETRRETVLGQFKSSIVEREGEKANEALKLVQQAEEDKSSTETRITKLLKERSFYEIKKNEAQQKLRELKTTSELQIKKENIKKKIDFKQEELAKKEKLFLQRFNTRSFAFFAQPLLMKALERLKSAEVADKGIKDMNANSINQIIKRGYCLCGSEIIEGNTAHKKLIEEMQYLPPQSIGVMINSYQESIHTFLDVSGDYYELINEIYGDILSARSEIGESYEEIKELDQLLEDCEDASLYQKRVTDAEAQLRRIDQTIGSSNKSIENYTTLIRENKEIYDKLISTSEKNKEIKTYMAYAEKLYNWAEVRYANKESVIRDELEKKVNEYFKAMYHGDRRVEIDEKYRVLLKTLTDTRETTTDESKGLETVKNFAFLAGLVDLAKGKFLDESNNLLNEEAAVFPLILDAPFSNADETHVANISNVLPRVAEQLIMIVMSKDWNYAEDQLLNRVGKRYTLSKISEVQTEIKEEVHI